MKSLFKKTICIFLVLTMIISFGVSSFANNTSSNANECSASLMIHSEKEKYSWGNNITFSVSVNNSGENPIDYATVSVIPKFQKFFNVADSQSVVSLPVGASKDVEFTVKSNCSIFIRIFMPIIKLFNIGVSSEYKSTNFDNIVKVNVNGLSFDFGFKTDYGYENTATGKEIEKIKELNDGELPDIYMDTEDGIPSFVDGVFSDNIISNEKDALNALNDIKNLMSFDKTSDELSFYQKDSYSGNTFYRFQQYYKGIEVYGKNIIVVADSSKKASALSDDYEPDININTNPSISEEKAIDVAKAYIDNASDALSNGLRVYATEMDPTLVYMISCTGTYEDIPFSGYIFVDANLGYVVASENLISYESVSASTDGMTFTAWKTSSGNYELIDKSRNIYVYDANKVKAVTDVNNNQTAYTIKSGASIATSDSKNSWNIEDARMMYNLASIYDYYYRHFSRSSFNNNNGQLIAIANDGYDSGNNGYSMSHIASPNTIIAIGYNTGCYRYDVLAHEYLHSTERYISNMASGNNETGGLKEAYADIMGEVLEADAMGGVIDWKVGTFRNIADPSKTSNPSKVPLIYTYKECHYISTIVSHAAYLMQQDKITDVNRLGELWYRSMYYLDMNSTFEDCRAAVIAAARDMGMTSAEIECIRSSFDAVGIDGKTLSFFGYSSISGKVIDATSLNPVAGAQVIAVKTAPNDWGAGIVETNSNGEFEITGLSSGTYEISVDAPGYRPELRYNIQVGAFSNVSLSSSILLSASVIEVGAIGGKITNAIDGKDVPNATVRFRENHGNKTGDYIKSGGNILQLTTDGSGKYSCENIKTGYYTMEVSKEGFITSYYDVIASPSNKICLNQNFSISPELPEGQYRIVLTWGENPRDLDSHITGNLSSGSSFHVYYSNKDAWDGDVHVANLDCDDTNGEGPETVTLIPTTAETYRYYIYRYAGSGSISTSGAHIEVYKGNAMIAVYDAPTNQGTGDYWTVFEITNGTLKTINKMGNSVYTSSTSSTNANVSVQSLAETDYMPPKNY